MGMNSCVALFDLSQLSGLGEGLGRGPAARSPSAAFLSRGRRGQRRQPRDPVLAPQGPSAPSSYPPLLVIFLLGTETKAARPAPGAVPPQRPSLFSGRPRPVPKRRHRRRKKRACHLQEGFPAAAAGAARHGSDARPAVPGFPPTRFHRLRGRTAPTTAPSRLSPADATARLPAQPMAGTRLALPPAGGPIGAGRGAGIAVYRPKRGRR